ncbi:MAG: hypothetical protein AAF851_06195 [Myxococcota bacterium]
MALAALPGVRARRMVWLLGLAACSEAASSGLGGLGGRPSDMGRAVEDLGFEPDLGRISDLGVGDTGAGPDAGPMRDCPLPEPRFVETAYLPNVVPDFVLQGDRLWVAVDDPNMPMQRRVSIADGSMSARLDGTVVMASAEGVALAIRRLDDGSSIFERQVEESITSFGPFRDVRLPGVNPLDPSPLRRARPVDGERAVLSMSSGRELLILEGPRAQRIGAPPGVVFDEPWVGGGDIVWTSLLPQGPQLVRWTLPSVAEGRDLDPDAFQVRGVSAGTELVWLEDGALWAADSNDGIRLARGPCGELSSDGERALAVCRDAEDTVLLSRLEGRTETLARLGEGGVITNPDADGDWIGWMEYEDPTAFFEPSPFPSGRVRLLHLPTGRQAEAPVGSGCYICGAIWPAPHLQLEAGHAAWNYAREDDRPVGMPVAALRLPDCPDR